MRRSGFTLVEMMIVVAIIAVLAGIAVPKFMKSYRKSQTTEAVRLMKQIADVEGTFYATHKKYVGNIATGSGVVKDADVNTTFKKLGTDLNVEGLFKNFSVEVCGTSTDYKGIIVSSWTSDEPTLKVYMFYPAGLTLKTPIDKDYYEGSVYLYDYINSETGGKHPECK